MVRLFEEDARVFTTLGIGVLTEIETMKIKDELNGEYELEMTYFVNGSFYDEIRLKRLIVTKAHVHDEEDQAFRIYNITTPINGKITVNARHISYDLSNITVEPFEATDPWMVIDKVREGIKYLSSDTRNKFTFNIVPATKPEGWSANDNETDDEEKEETKLKVNTPSSLRSVLGGDNSMLSTFGGELIFNNFTVTYYTKDNRVGQDRGFEVRYGKNMTAFEHKKTVRNDFTAIYPYYAKKTTVEDAEQLLSYQPMYIAKGNNKDKAFTRMWLSTEEGGEPIDASKKLVSKTSPISNAIQVKTKGEYYNKLYVFISDSLLNNYGVLSNGAVGELVNTVSSYVRIFRFVKVSDAADFKYIPNNFYYTEGDESPERLQEQTFMLDTNEQPKEGRNYYNAVLKGTDNVLAGHYYPVPLYAYVANGSPDLVLSGGEVDIDDNVNNTNLWLSYEENGDPISRNVTNMYMMAIPMQIQNGVAKDHFVIFNPLTKKYKELKSGIEKTYASTDTTNTEEVTELVTLKKFNEVTMDSEKLVNGTNYYYGIDSYDVCESPTSETWKENTYYYEGTPIYNRVNVNADTYQKETYYQYIKESNEYTRIDSDDFPSGVIMYDKVTTYTLSTEFDETIATWYTKNTKYASIYKWVGLLTQQEYTPEKYYYIENNKYKRDDNEIVTDNRNYYQLLVCNRILPELHYKRYEQNKYYYPELVSGTTDEVVMNLDSGQSWSNKMYCEGVNDYVENIIYYIKSEDAPLIYLSTEKDDSKVLSIDLSSSFESKPDAELLLEAANKYIEDNKDDFNAIDDSFSTSFVRLSDSIDYQFIGDIEEIQNGDIVKIIFPYLVRDDIPETDKHVNLRVTSMEYDPLSNRYTAIELGDKNEDLSDTVLTSGADVSSLKNDSGYVGRAEVKKLIADTIIAQNLTVEGLLSAARAELTELVSTVISTQDLNADNIVAGNIGATNVVVKSNIAIEGYTLLDVQPTNQNEFDEIANQHEGYLYYKEAEYASTYIQVPSNQTVPGTDGFLYDKTYYYKNGTVFRVNNNGDVYANNVDLTGKITATSGDIGGCRIIDGVLQIEGASIGNLSANKIVGGTLSASDIMLGPIYNDNHEIIDYNFKVDTNGNATMSGNLYMTGGSIKLGANVESGTITDYNFNLTEQGIVQSLFCNQIKIQDITIDYDESPTGVVTYKPTFSTEIVVIESVCYLKISITNYVSGSYGKIDVVPYYVISSSRYAIAIMGTAFGYDSSGELAWIGGYYSDYDQLDVSITQNGEFMFSLGKLPDSVIESTVTGAGDVTVTSIQPNVLYATVLQDNRWINIKDKNGNYSNIKLHNITSDNINSSQITSTKIVFSKFEYRPSYYTYEYNNFYAFMGCSDIGCSIKSGYTNIPKATSSTTPGYTEITLNDTSYYGAPDVYPIVSVQITLAANFRFIDGGVPSIGNDWQTKNVYAGCYINDHKAIVRLYNINTQFATDVCYLIVYHRDDSHN